MEENSMSRSQENSLMVYFLTPNLFIGYWLILPIAKMIQHEKTTLAVVVYTVDSII